MVWVAVVVWVAVAEKWAAVAGGRWASEAILSAGDIPSLPITAPKTGGFSLHDNRAKSGEFLRRFRILRQKDALPP
ncbi:MAG: hypothetical protein AB1711_06840 [Thermodesulfobacteriota bacterium]